MALPIGVVGTASTENQMGTTCLSRVQFVPEALHRGVAVIASSGTKQLQDTNQSPALASSAIAYNAWSGALLAE